MNLGLVKAATGFLAAGCAVAYSVWVHSGWMQEKISQREAEKIAFDNKRTEYNKNPLIVEGIVSGESGDSFKYFFTVVGSLADDTLINRPHTFTSHSSWDPRAAKAFIGEGDYVKLCIPYEETIRNSFVTTVGLEDVLEIKKASVHQSPFTYIIKKADEGR